MGTFVEKNKTNETPEEKPIFGWTWNTSIIQVEENVRTRGRLLKGILLHAPQCPRSRPGRCHNRRAMPAQAQPCHWPSSAPARRPPLPDSHGRLHSPGCEKRLVLKIIPSIILYTLSDILYISKQWVKKVETNNP